MWGPGSNEGAYDYSPFPGTSTRQQQNLKDYDKKYSAAAKKLQKQGYVVQGDNYFKRVPDPSKPGGSKLVKAGKVETGHTNEALKVVPAKPQKQAAPPQAALDPNGSNGARGENRTTVKPVNGSFRTAVEQGPDGKVTPNSGNAGGAQSTDPQGSGYIAPAGEPRVNANGLLSYGRDLSSLNAFSKAWLGDEYEITDIKSAFQSNDLEGSYQNGSNTISTEDSKYTLPDSATPSNVGGKYTMDGGDISTENTGYKIDGGSVPGTVGGNANDPQDGTSSKPDVAESIRTVRMERQSGRGSRRDPRNRGADSDMFGGPEPSDASLTSPMYKNAKRNEIRRTFLDYEGSSVKAAAAANAKAHFGKDSDGNARFNYGGELVYAKDGMEWKAKNAAMMGQDPTQFLDIPATPDTQPDTPAASELSPSFATETPGAQEFFKAEIKKVKDKNK